MQPTARETDVRTPWALLALVALPPALIAVLQLGRMHPDEVFQYLEPAQHFAFGDGVLSFEWHKGMRNWALPGALGLLLKLCGAIGIDDPQLRRAALELPQYALHLAALGALYRLVSRRMGALAAAHSHARLFVLAAVALCAWQIPVLNFAGRTLSESFSAPLLLWGLERADLRDARDRVYAQAGALLGLAVVARYGSAVIALVVLLVLAAQHRRRALLFVVIGGGAVALLLGALDFASWGMPFHSFVAYFKFNVGGKRVIRDFGSSPWWFYVEPLALGVAPWVWASGLYALWRRRAQNAARPSALFAWSTFGYLLVIACTPHKEVRFLYPAIVVFSACVAPATVDLFAALARAPIRVALRRTLAIAAFSFALCSGAGALAAPSHFVPHGTEQFRMFVEAVRGGRGVLLLHSGKWGVPGAFYAAGHPSHLCDDPGDDCTKKTLRTPLFDRIVAWHDEGSGRFRRYGFVPLDRKGPITLWGR